MPNLRRWLQPPTFDDDDRTRNAALLNTLSLTVIVLSIIYALSAIILQLTVSIIGIAMISAGNGVLVNIITRRGKTRLAAVLLSMGLWVIFTLGAVFGTGRGLHDDSFSGYIVVVLITGLLLGGRAGLYAAGLASVSGLVMLLADFGRVASTTTDSTLTWTSHSLYFFATAVLVTLATRGLRVALIRAQLGEQLLDSRNLELQGQMQEREQAEEAYRLLVEHSLQGLVILQGRRVVFTNAAMSRISGYAVDELYAMDSIGLLAMDEDRDAVTQYFLSFHTDIEAPPKNILRVRHKDGTLRWVEQYPTPITYRQKPALQITVIDITERMVAEENLRRQQTFLRHVIDSSPYIIAIKDREGRFVAVNESAARQYQVTIDEMIGKTDFDYAGSREEAVKFQQDDLAVFANGEPVFVPEESVTYSDGSIHWHRTAKIPITLENGEPGVMCVAGDITEIKQSQTALKAERDYSNLILSNSPVMIIGLTPEGVTRFVNPAVERITGYRDIELTGQYWWQQVCPDDEIAEVEQAFNDLAAGIIRDYEVTITTETGERRTILWNAINRTDDMGTVIERIGFGTDITPLIMAIRSVRESQQRLSLLIQQTSVIIMEWDANYVLSEWNPAAERIFGFNREEALGRSSIDLIVPAAAQKQVQTLFEDMRQNPRNIFNINDNITRDGRIITCEWFNLPLIDEHGTVIGYAALAQDITERRLAEKALRDNEERLQLALDIAQLRMWQWDMNTDRLRGTDVATGELFGPSHMTRFYDRVHDDDRQQLQKLVQKSIDEDLFFRMDYRLKHRDGRATWVSALGRNLYDEKRRPIAMFGVSQDITERKLAEQALRESEERLRLALDAARLRMWHWDMVNDRLEGAHIITGEPFNAMTISQFYGLIHQDEREKVQALVQRSVDDDQTYRMEYRFRMPDDSEIWVASLGRAFYDEHGHPVTMLGVSQDITDRKEAEKQHIELALASERVETLTEFFTNISHDLKTPLSVITTSLYLIERLNDPKKQQDKLKLIKDQTQLLEDYIQDILTIFRLNHTERLNKASVQMNRLLGRTIDRLSAKIELKHQQLKLELDSGLPLVAGDADELGRMLLNLVENAVNYTPNDGMITIRTRTEPQCAVIEVVDTGIGIDSDVLPYIFNRFYRADNAQSFQNGGTGLGLAIVKRIVEMHDGTVEVDSTPNSGSTFRVCLPFTKERASV